MPTMTISDNITYEFCPECNYPYHVKVEHGQNAESGSNMHYWHCPDCGDSMVFVAYDCPHCKLKAMSCPK